MQLLEKEVRDGNRERVDLGGSERLLDQATLDSECSLPTGAKTKPNQARTMPNTTKQGLQPPLSASP